MEKVQTGGAKMKKGDKIQCWTKEEFIKKRYQLAAKGILVKDDPTRELRYIVKKGDEDEE